MLTLSIVYLFVFCEHVLLYAFYMFKLDFFLQKWRYFPLVNLNIIPLVSFGTFLLISMNLSLMCYFGVLKTLSLLSVITLPFNPIRW